MAAESGVEDQARLLEDALMVVRTQSQLMSRFLDQPVCDSSFKPSEACILIDEFVEQAHGCSKMRVCPTILHVDLRPHKLTYVMNRSTLISELRTSALGPKQVRTSYTFAIASDRSKVL